MQALHGMQGSGGKFVQSVSMFTNLDGNNSLDVRCWLPQAVEEATFAIGKSRESGDILVLHFDTTFDKGGNYLSTLNLR